MKTNYLTPFLDPQSFNDVDSWIYRVHSQKVLYSIFSTIAISSLHRTACSEPVKLPITAPKSSFKSYKKRRCQAIPPSRWNWVYLVFSISSFICFILFLIKIGFEVFFCCLIHEVNVNSFVGSGHQNSVYIF